MEHNTTIIINGRDLNKIFDLAKEYFPTQGFKWASENKPVMIVYKRGSAFGVTTKGIKTTLTMSFRAENAITTINAHYKLPAGVMSEGSRKIFKNEIDGFKEFVENSIPIGASSILTPESKQSPTATESSIKCPHCEAPVQQGWKACPGCGNKLSPSCPHCKAEIQAEWKACPACGEKLG